MGYTHYWKIKEDLDKDIFDKAVADCDKIATASGIPLAGIAGEAGTQPSFNGEEIVFNGVEDEAHESFVIRPEAVKFEFCKTARKPYDIVVCACLVIMKHYFGDKIEVSSDGGLAEWQDALTLCQDTLGYGQEFDIVNGELILP